jgi:PAS domain S-box-containing protein
VMSVEQGIRARKAAEKLLRESEAKFRALVESTSDWIWEVDEHGKYTYSSPQVHDLLGYTVGEVIGRTAYDLMMPEDAGRLKEQFAAIVAGRKHFHLLENANLHKDGRVVFLETSGTPMFDGQGVFKGYRGIDRDITERKEAEKERRANAEKLEQVLFQTIEAIASTVEARDPYTAGH